MNGEALRTVKAWDDSEDYAIVGELDVLIRQNGFTC